LSVCIASHHGGLMDCLTPDEIDGFERRIYKEDEKLIRRNASKSLIKVLSGILESLKPDFFKRLL
jgi:CRISPR-associated endonuclease/helicase Cas3